jgi:hypothetical protein
MAGILLETEDAYHSRPLGVYPLFLMFYVLCLLALICY